MEKKTRNPGFSYHREILDSFFALPVVFRMVSRYASVFPDISFSDLLNRNNSSGSEEAFT